MASSPTFTSTVQIGYPLISTANTNRDGTGTLGTVLTGVAAGTVVRDVTIQAAGTTTAGMVRLFVSLDGGTTKRLIHEISITAATPSATVKAFRTVIYFDGVTEKSLVLPNASAILYASTHNAESFNVIASGEDLT